MFIVYYWLLVMYGYYLLFVASYLLLLFVIGC